MYVTPTVLVDGQQFPTKTSTTPAITMDFPSSLNGTGGWSRVPFEGVNILPLGSQFNIDARIAKTIPFTERLRGQFAFDAFNATNHRNISAVQTSCLHGDVGSAQSGGRRRHADVLVRLSIRQHLAPRASLVPAELVSAGCSAKRISHAAIGDNVHAG
ncbi:MAG: hypothetical protein WDO73_28820 [Ignavibacteriota bacterium]